MCMEMEILLVFIPGILSKKCSWCQPYNRLQDFVHQHFSKRRNKLMKMLFFKYENVFPNSHFIMELMELVLTSAVMKFQEEFFLQILGNKSSTHIS